MIASPKCKCYTGDGCFGNLCEACDTRLTKVLNDYIYALRPFAQYWKIKKTIRNTPTEGEVLAVHSGSGDGILTVEDFEKALKLIKSTDEEIL